MRDRTQSCIEMYWKVVGLNGLTPRHMAAHTLVTVDDYKQSVGVDCVALVLEYVSRVYVAFLLCN